MLLESCLFRSNLQLFNGTINISDSFKYSILHFYGQFRPNYRHKGHFYRCKIFTSKPKRLFSSLKPGIRTEYQGRPIQPQSFRLNFINQCPVPIPGSQLMISHPYSPFLLRHPILSHFYYLRPVNPKNRNNTLMLATQFSYTALLLAVLTIPVLFSFGPNIQFYRKWKYSFPAILLTALVFMFWDARFTQVGIWNFNPEYTLGINYLGMPIEEWLFFLIFPFCSLFIYEGVKHYLDRFRHDNAAAAISLVLIAVSALLCFLHRQQAYTFFNFLFLTVYLGYTLFRNRFKQHLSQFYLSYLIGLIPFLIVSGILSSLPVIQYHPDHIIGLRFIDIPVENFGYFFLLLLMNTTIYETLKEGRYF